MNPAPPVTSTRFMSAGSLRIPWPPVRKWWLESVREAPSEDAHRRLVRSNAHTAVQIETVDAVPAGDADGEPWSLDQRLLQEAHHTQYGRPWILGRHMFDFLVESGLRP